MEDIYKTVSVNIRKYREKAGLTQQQLADEIDVGYVYISKLECNKTGVRLNTLQRIAKVLGISVSQLVELTPHKISEDKILNTRLQRFLTGLKPKEKYQLAKLFDNANKILKKEI